MNSKPMCLGVVLGVALTSAPALADGQATARALGQKGLELFDARRFQDAYDKLHEADAIYHAPTLTLYMARSLRELGKLVEARSLYERIITDPAAKGVFAETRENARAELDALVPRIASVEVVVTGASYEAARVRLDRAILPAGRQMVNPGSHTIETGTNAASAMKTLTLAEGENRKIEIVAPRHEEPTPSQRAKASRSSPLFMPALVIGGGAASALALGMGIGLSVWSNSAAATRNTFRAGCNGGDQGSCNQFDGYEQRRWLTGNAAVYSFVGAGALAIATGTYALVATRAKRSVEVAGSAGPGGAALKLSFAW